MRALCLASFFSLLVLAVKAVTQDLASSLSSSSSSSWEPLEALDLELHLDWERTFRRNLLGEDFW